MPKSIQIMNPTYFPLEEWKCQFGAPCCFEIPWLTWMIYDDIFKGAQQRRHLNLSPTPATLTIRQIVKICLGTLADQFFLHIQNERFGNWYWYWDSCWYWISYQSYGHGPKKFVSCPLQCWDESQAWGLRILATTLFKPPKRKIFVWLMGEKRQCLPKYPGWNIRPSFWKWPSFRCFCC